MPSTRQQIELWKTRLLDLSRRNRLLNARHGLSNLLALTHPAVDPLFDALVRRRRRLPFAVALTLEERLAALSWDTPATGVTMRLDRIPIPPPRPDQLATDVQPAEQERVLYNMRLRARTALTEQGVNILFVALGFLEWFAPEDPEAVLRSPLLLLPVEIQRAPLGVEYALKLLDDEIVLNPTLAHKLRKDYGLALPDLPEDDDDLHPEQIFAQISELIAGHDGWQVLPEAALGLFSFLKLLMYHDLERAATAGSHPILALLAGDKAHVDGENPLLSQTESPAEPLDSRPPEACYQVLDADSSQAEAIAAARAGASFVLQGPPGTGKSQTIANIIAECMAAGQRVLFVSEKMAALQVVFERLKRCGLDAFCLELHSHKANKRDVLAALGAALDAPPPPAPLPFPYAELAATRDQLNAYARALHTPHGPLRWTAYTAHARAASLAGAPDCDAPLGDLDTFTSERIGAIDVLLAKLDARRELLQSLPSNLWRGCTITTGSFEQRGRIRARLRALIAALGELERVAGALAERFGLPAPEGIAAARTLATLAGLLREPQSDAFWLAAPEASADAADAIAAARRLYAEHSETEARLGQRHQPAVLDGDLDRLLQRFTEQYASWTRILRPQYHRDMAALRATLQPGAELDYASALADLRLAADVAARRREEAEHAPTLAARLGPLFSRHTTDWNALQANYDWAARLLALALPCPLPAPLREAAGAPQPTRAALLADSSRLDTALVKLDEELAFFETLFPTTDDRRPTTDDRGPRTENREPAESRGLKKEDSSYAAAKLQSSILHPPSSTGVSGRWSVVGGRDVPQLLERMGDLDAWWEFCELRRAAEPLDITAYLDALAADPEAAAQPRRAFHKHFCQIWLDAAYDRLPPLRHFRPDQHTALIGRFRELDSGQLIAAQERLRHLLAARRPPPTSAALPGSELAILRRELQKQRRHKPIRQLFREIPALLGQLKPCLLMSPLSVSQFLDPDAIRFDLVIFDEASQIRTEEAAGAVLRGAALVVVGDNKQLPPTSFFVADAEDHPETDEGEVPDSFESILDASSASGLPSRLLRWHYRSRDEALITFSNTHFYGGRLATFPGAAVVEGQGVSFEHVADGCYDRQGTRTNLAEARRVADLVAAHLQATPARSLGVVAFSQAQQLAILHELERRRAADESLAILFDEGRAEPFFVKNLENVQGDERDVMIVSVGYGRDAAGRLLMNFGPLNQQGGERRLNVAITRARERAVLVSSLLPEDIDLRRTQHPGPRLLRAYIEYARRGGPGSEARMEDGGSKIAQPSPILHPPSSINTRFEDDLAAALARHGLELARQIGHSDFRIDIAIRDPRDPAHFLLGVECDGADYRDAPTARDRERLREQVLGTLGWRIHRAWSAAWAQDFEAEVRRVLAALEGPAAKEQS